ncbi:MAG: PilZ domain-containing protein [Planctomycetota bacterium]|nr:MAG: PilZ domain-containing protein [Planctomycetota bacterium]
MNLEVTQKLTRDAVFDFIRQQKTPPPEEQVAVEKRKYPRWPIGGIVEFWPADGDWQSPWKGICKNISLGGLGITCDRHIEPQTLVGIIMSSANKSFHGLATVRYCQKVRDKYMVGLEFNYYD